MDLKTVLTSSVIAAIITGLLSLITNFSNQKNDSKIKYVTEERKNWRQEIRIICDELNNANSKEDVQRQLIKLKVKINAFGNTDIYDSCYKKSFNSEKLENRKELIQLTQFYKNDGHIWKQIHKIEKEDVIEKNDITTLIEYLSYLLKYDWERSKSEVLFNTQVLYSRFIFILSLTFAIIQTYQTSSNNEFFKNAFSIVMIFSVSFIFSSIPKYDLFEQTNYDKYKIIGISAIPILIIMVIISIINSKILFSDLDDNHLMLIPLVLLILSISLNCGAVVKSISLDERYRDLLFEYNKSNLDM